MKSLTLRLDDETYERLRRVAFDHRMTISDVIRERIRDGSPETLARIASTAQRQVQAANPSGKPMLMRDVIKERL